MSSVLDLFNIDLKDCDFINHHKPNIVEVVRQQQLPPQHQDQFVDGDTRSIQHDDDVTLMGEMDYPLIEATLLTNDQCFIQLSRIFQSITSLLFENKKE